MAMSNHSILLKEDNVVENTVLSGDEEVSIGQISDDDDEIIGSITSAALAVLSLQDGQQRPHSALDSSMSDAQKIAAGKSAQTCTRPKIFVISYVFVILTCFHLTNFFWRRKIQRAAFQKLSV